MGSRHATANWTPRLHIASAAVFAAIVQSGCGTYSMMPTPALYVGERARPLFTVMDADRRKPPLDLFYVTDRVRAANLDNAQPYTSDRARHIAFGSTVVEFGQGISWDTLVAQSLSPQRSVTIDLKLGSTAELGRFPEIPYEIERTTAGLSRTPAVIAAHEAAKSALQTELERRLGAAPRKEVVVFVHGFANTFEDAVLTTGELCHFLGREFVCMVFTWPAGGTKGVFFGYDVDRESAEFAVEDLKKTIRMVSGTSGVQKIHLLAHSRGTDLLATAVSDLSVEAYASRSSIARKFKIGNIVLMAPDLDFDVAFSKIWKVVSDPDLPYGDAPRPDAVVPSPEFHITVYVSPNDKALATAGWLFGSLVRVGRVDVSMVRPEGIAQARVLSGFDIIQVAETNCFICHSYFVSNPRVSADLIAMLRYGLKPNDPGRPLIEVKLPFWRVPTTGEGAE